MRQGGAARDERGAAVVVGVALTGLLLVLASACVGSVAIVLAHRGAQASADLAALAGAGALQRGAEPCVAARAIAARDQAALTRCLVDGSTVVVATAVALPRALGGGTVPARSRAGPVTALPEN
jgi:secretion/DNA translocation related TadE-like protein